MDRAQFLQNLRTGGPRSTSFGQAPLTANPAQTRFASSAFQPGYIDESAQLVDRFGNISLNGPGSMTANPDLVAAALQQQQQQQIALLQAQAQVAAMIAQQGGGPAAEAQAMHMQMELMKIQALQQQQNFQTQMMLQQQMQQQQQQQQLRQAPSTAGPFQSSFPDAAAAQTRTAAAAQLRARAAGREATMRASVSEEQIAPPMTAGVNGKFGVGVAAVAANNRVVSSPLNPNAAAFVGRFNPDLSAAVAAATSRPSVSEVGSPATPTYGATTVISGGTALGSPGGVLTPSNSYNGLSGYNNSGVTPGPTKSDSAASWRRGSTSSTPVQVTPTNGFNKAPSPPSRQRSISPPNSGSSTPSKLNMSSSVVSLNSEVSGRNSIISPLKTRPSPLRFTSPPPADGVAAAFGHPAAMALRSGSPSNSNDGISLNDDAASSIKSSPTSSTPPSSAGSAAGGHTGGAASAKEREEAAKKLYEGLGLGRPAPYAAMNNVVVPSTAALNQKVEPIRQPLGPPCSVDELGPLNFASRMRKKALGGLMDARERREAAAALNLGLVHA